jgi:hypothetical protein
MKTLAKVYNANKRTWHSDQWIDDDNLFEGAVTWKGLPFPDPLYPATGSKSGDCGLVEPEEGHIDFPSLGGMSLFWMFSHLFSLQNGAHSGSGFIILNFNMQQEEFNSSEYQIIVTVYSGLNPSAELKYVLKGLKEGPVLMKAVTSCKERPLVVCSYNERAIRNKANRRAKDGMNRIGPKFDPVTMGCATAIHMGIAALDRVKQGYKLLKEGKK